MRWVLLAILLLIVLIAIIFMTRVKVFLDFYHGNDNDHLKITVKAWGGLIKYKVDIPVIKIDDNSPAIIAEEEIETGPSGEFSKEKTAKVDQTDFLNSIHDFKQLIIHISGLHRIIRAFLRKITIRQLEWHSMIGIADAAAAGVLAGAIWAVKGSLIGVLSHYMKLKDMPVMSVTPNFQRAISISSFKCIFQVRVGHAILAGIKLVKYWKGGWPEFKTKPLSVLSGDKTNSV